MYMRILLLIAAIIELSSFLGNHLLLPVHADANSPALSPDIQRANNGWMLLNIQGRPNAVQILMASLNLQEWQEIAVIHHTPFSFEDPASAELDRRFYTLRSRAKTNRDDWKNVIVFPEYLPPDIDLQEPFFSRFSSYGEGGQRWIKFAILQSDPTRVIYQDSQKYPFHYDFATTRLEQFKGMSPQAFEEVSLYLDNQQIVLGAVVTPFVSILKEVGIQFVGAEPFPKESVRQWFELTRSSINSISPLKVLYLPTFEQSRQAQSDAVYYLSHGIELSSNDRWLSGNTCYSTGWALGELKFFPAQAVEQAYNDGRLRPNDLLLTDAVGAEAPLVAAIICLTPSTPNSHVAILSQAAGVPFVYLRHADAQAQAQTLVGKEVYFSARHSLGGINISAGCQIQLFEFDPVAPATVRSDLLNIKQAKTITIVPKQAYGSISARVDQLRPADTKYFGGKAANLGLLRRTIANNSPEAIGLSFDLWDTFLDQTIAPGQSLRQIINGRLSHYSYPPTNMEQLKADLAYIRDVFRDTTRFTAEQKNEIVTALAIFDPQRKIRFRSSTNVEDTESFTGAGLYDSYSGCLADDLDDDDQGPSVCDPQRKNERGVFRAIKKVYASFYNDNAFLERLRYEINESEVGMAVLVHHSFPDEIELANGVATVTKKGNNYTMQLVTQLGAVSVANPDSNARAEVVRASKYGDSKIYLHLEAYSSLVPLGGHIMQYESEYLRLAQLLLSTTKAYERLFPSKVNFTLDFEYKQIEPRRLMVKQVREIPSLDSDEDITAFLLHQAITLATFQGEHGDIMANHRLKSRWNLRTQNRRLSAPQRMPTLYEHLQLEYVNAAAIEVLSQEFTQLPNFTHTSSSSQHTDSWSMQLESQSARFSLGTQNLNQNVNPQLNPAITLADLRLTLTVDYSVALPTIGSNQYNPTRQEKIVLAPDFSQMAPPLKAILQTRQIRQDNVSILSQFYWPAAPTGPTAGYTAPLLKWVKTEIRGVTATPIELRGFYSQTYLPGHHNFWEEFIFEPQLEEGLSEPQIAELNALNLRLIYAFKEFDQAKIRFMGRDGRLRNRL
jgi:hypothetical protein